MQAALCGRCETKTDRRAAADQRRARLLKHQEMKKKITIEVPEALHKKFSAKVKKRKTNKTAAITKLIRGY